MKIRIGIAGGFFVAIACLLLGQTGSPQHRIVTVEVVCKDKTGAAITDLDIAISDGRLGVLPGASGKTDATGHASLSTSVTSGTTKLFVVAFVGAALVKNDPNHPAIVRQRDLTSVAGLRSYYELPISDASSAYSLAIDLPQVISVTGRLVGVAQRNSTSVGMERSDVRVCPDDVGNFALQCVPKNSATVLWIVNALSGACKRVPLTSDQTSADLNLGDITWEEATADKSVSIAATNLHRRLAIPLGWRSHVTVVSVNGSVIYEMPFDQEGRAQRPDGTTGAPKMPAGAYYVASGAASMGGVEGLLQLLRDGRSAELEDRQYPKLVVADGGTNEVAFDAEAAAAIVQSLLAK